MNVVCRAIRWKMKKFAVSWEISEFSNTFLIGNEYWKLLLFLEENERVKTRIIILIKQFLFFNNIWQIQRFFQREKNWQVIIIRFQACRQMKRMTHSKKIFKNWSNDPENYWMLKFESTVFNIFQQKDFVSFWIELDWHF